MGILRRNGTLTDMNRILTTILLGLFIPIYTFAEYDGRMADDPYHKSPTWIYILLVVGLFALIGKLAKGGTHKKARRSQGPPLSPKTIYKSSGRYWTTCPECNGTGYVDGKESYVFPKNPYTISLGKVVCDKCKGFCHKLTPEASDLYKELSIEEQKEGKAARDRLEQTKKEKEKFEKERSDKLYEVRCKIVREGRKVHEQQYYIDELEKLRNRRMEIVNRIKEISKSQPICPSCNGLNSDCFDCHGIGHIFNEALTKAYEEFLQYRSERTLIYTDYMALYGNDSISINKIALSPFILPDNAHHVSPKTEIIRNRIRNLVKEESLCLNCMAKGYVEVWMDKNGKAYERIGCPKCHGQGKLYYD